MRAAWRNHEAAGGEPCTGRYSIRTDLKPLLQLYELLRRVVMGRALHLRVTVRPNTPEWSSRWSVRLALRLESCRIRMMAVSACVRYDAVQRASRPPAAALVESRC